LVDVAEDLNPTLLKKERLIKTDLKSAVDSDSLAEKLRAAETINTAEAIQQYRTRVKEFLADQQLNPIEEFQLATLAKVLGISDLMASQVVKEEQQAIEAARTSYRTVFLETIHKGYYPFNAQINQELKDLQRQLGLRDAEVEEITLPIIISYEKTHRSPAQRTTHPAPVTYLPTPQPKATPIKNLALGALVAALGVATTLLVVNSSLRPSTDQGQSPTADTGTPASTGSPANTGSPADSGTPTNTGTPAPPVTTPASPASEPHPMGPTPGPNEVPAVIDPELGGLTIRVGRDGQANAIGTFAPGEVFQVLPQDREGWWPVRKSNGLRGYVYSTRITLNPSSASGESIPTEATNFHPLDPNNPNPPQGVRRATHTSFNDGFLVVRSGKTTRSAELDRLVIGEVFETIPQQNETWWPVRTEDGTLGYSSSRYIQLE
jgi:hypothetical protein